MVDMDADWPLPRPITLFKRELRSAASSAASSLARNASVASTFSSLATPVVADAVRHARDLATSGDAEGFHQLRVAFRKLRALYWAYSPYLGEETTAVATEEFKRLAAVAGATRDWDVAGDLLRAAQASRASMGLLVAAVREKREQAVARSKTLINSAEIEAFLNDVLRRAQASLESKGDDLRIGEFAEKRIRRARRALVKRSQHASRQEPALEDDLHDVRKAGKKLRYLLEFFQPVIKSGSSGFNRSIRQLTSVQNKLGQFNDIAASENLIRSASFNDVPPEVVEESLQWLKKRKCKKIRSASRRVRAMAR